MDHRCCGGQLGSRAAEAASVKGGLQRGWVHV